MTQTVRDLKVSDIGKRIRINLSDSTLEGTLGDLNVEGRPIRGLDGRFYAYLPTTCYITMYLDNTRAELTEVPLSATIEEIDTTEEVDTPEEV